MDGFNDGASVLPKVHGSVTHPSASVGPHSDLRPYADANEAKSDQAMRFGRSMFPPIKVFQLKYSDKSSLSVFP